MTGEGGLWLVIWAGDGENDIDMATGSDLLGSIPGNASSDFKRACAEKCNIQIILERTAAEAIHEGLLRVISQDTILI